MKQIYAKNTNMRMLSVFNYDRKKFFFVRAQKRTKADKNVCCAFQPQLLLVD